MSPPMYADAASRISSTSSSTSVWVTCSSAIVQSCYVWVAGSNAQEVPVDDNTPAIDPRHSALLVMDYQAGIVGRIADADALLARMRAAIDLARERGMTVGYVRVALTDDERES